MLCDEMSYSMSTPSSPSRAPEDDADDDAVDVLDDRDASWLRLHCSSSSIMRTRREISRTWEELQCMRELDWRCMRSSDAETRE